MIFGQWAWAYRGLKRQTWQIFDGAFVLASLGVKYGFLGLRSLTRLVIFVSPDFILIFEFDGSRGDRMSDDLLLALRKRTRAPNVRHWKGLWGGLHQGGVAPARLLNLLWLGFRSLPALLVGPGRRTVIVRSTPPLLHLPVAMICRWRGIRCVFWLMDYHPVIEQRLWAKRTWLRPLLAWLNAWDRRELGGFDLVVVLDEAMAEIIRCRSTSARVAVHPTWGAPIRREADAAGAEGRGDDSPLVFAYLGNFGQGHGWNVLAGCIREVARLRRVRLLTVGVPAAAEPAFAKLAREMGSKCDHHPRLPFAEAAKLLREQKVSWGCVAMKAELAGCLSPSKFSGYLAAGVPLLYAGPAKTNAWQVCVEFGGGLALDDAASPGEIARAARDLADGAKQARAAAGAARARAHFDSFNGETLAKLITGTPHKLGAC